MKCKATAFNMPARATYYTTHVWHLIVFDPTNGGFRFHVIVKLIIASHAKPLYRRVVIEITSYKPW